MLLSSKQCKNWMSFKQTQYNTKYIIYEWIYIYIIYYIYIYLPWRASGGGGGGIKIVNEKRVCQHI